MINQIVDSLTSKEKPTSVLFIQKSKQKDILKHIEISGLVPDEVSYNYSPSFAGSTILGRMSPIQIFTGGSNKVYSFSVTIHEDMLENNIYNRLDDLVDALKSLSYPVIALDGSTYLPEVYFQIGYLSGTGFITTSVSWRKPFRNGRYIMADLSFSITVEEIYPEVNMTIEPRDLSSEESPYIVYASNIINRNTGLNTYNPIFATGAIGYDNFGDYDITAENFLSGEDAYNVNRAIMQYVDAQFDEGLARLKNIYGTMANLDYNNEELVGINDLLQELSLVTINVERISVSDSLDSVQNRLNNLREEFVEFLDYYYDNINKNMTREQYNTALDSINTIIDNMEMMYEVAVGYGAGY